MYQLDEKIYFYGFFVIPVLIVLFLGLQIWKNRAQKNFADKELLNKLSPDRSVFKPVLKLVFILLAIASLTMALVNPKIGTKSAPLDTTVPNTDGISTDQLLVTLFTT